MNSTIEYYNSHAEAYYDSTYCIELQELYEKFLRYIPENGRIVDLGCGSGRDVKWFRDHGYIAYGLDASEELVKISKAKLGIPVEQGFIEEWISKEPFDGIWCCGSLMHLDGKCIDEFFANLKYNLAPSGILLFSVKTGIQTGTDKDGRFFHNYSRNDIVSLANKNKLNIIDMWYSKDKLKRKGFNWLNAIMQRS